MSSLKDALARVTRVARHAELLRHNQQVAPVPSKGDSSAKIRQLPPRDRVPKHHLEKLRPHLRGFQKKRYQRFLEPLDMPQLKIYSNTNSPYNATRAEANFASKKSTDRIDVFNNFLSERFVFNKMVDFLVELTPEYLKSAETVSDADLLTSVLNEESVEFHRNRYENVPRYHFHEVPPVPTPLTKESFQQYIFYLTHLRILYRNLSSLASGIVPEILLYTHHLDNDEFKPYRSVHTYNYLIKYFGYDKFQNSFARELLLVMSKDGHRPNLDTINQLLKICRIHTNRRSLVSTYKVVINYLTLAKRLGLKVNLSTWNRVYDCIDNIFLKELLLNKIASINLPVLYNLCLRILEDYSKTTRTFSDVVHFIESDLQRPNWRQDPRFAEKVIYHGIVNAEKNEAFGKVWTNLVEQVSVDGVTLKTIVNGISSNHHLTGKTSLAVNVYSRLKNKVDVPPEVYGKLIQMICLNEENLDVTHVNFLVRALIHIDAAPLLNLPVEYTEYEPSSEKSVDGQKLIEFPYQVPTLKMSEHYKIMKRLTKHHLIDLEAKCIYLRNSQPHLNVPMPWDPTLEHEQELWQQQKLHMDTTHGFWSDANTFAPLGKLPVSPQPVPEKVVSTYKRLAHINMGISHDINLVRRLQTGFDRHIEHEMLERNIYGAPSVHK